MKITRDEAKRIADLAHLEFDDPSLDRMAAEMTKILGYIDQLAEVDLAADGPDATAISQFTALRDDTPQAPLDRERVAANAPAWSDGFFVVPKVIGE